jgi:hypothetical protein
VLLVARHGALLEILPAREARAQDLAEYVDRLKRLLALESLRGGRDAGGEPDAAVATLESIERTELARLAARLEGR